MKAVILDGYTVNPGDLSWDSFGKLFDHVDIYDKTPADQIIERIGDSEVVISNKCKITREIMEAAPNLKFIGEAATGYNNIDTSAAAELGIAVTNVPAYATDSVAQHVMALILELTNNVALHNASVHAGDWQRSEHFCYWLKPYVLLKGKSLGIVGYGAIGKRTAEIAKAFGMTIHIYSRDKEAAMKSDYVSLHCPLADNNYHMVNDDFINGMKDGAVLINTARGALVDEVALAKALTSGKLAAAATDVLETEPPAADNPLIGLENCLITPHIAWAAGDMRQEIIDVLVDNVKCWMKGEEKNRV